MIFKDANYQMKPTVIDLPEGGTQITKPNFSLFLNSAYPNPLQYGTVKHLLIFHDGNNTVQTVSGKYPFQGCQLFRKWMGVITAGTFHSYFCNNWAFRTNCI